MRLVYLCPNCKTAFLDKDDICSMCDSILSWLEYDENEARLLENWHQGQYRNLIFLDSGELPIKSRQEKITKCLDSYDGISVLITPKSVWGKLNEKTSRLSTEYDANVVAVCIAINTKYPLLIPASIPNQEAILLKELASDRLSLSLPPNSEYKIANIFDRMKVMQIGNSEILSIRLQRAGENLDKGELQSVSQLTGKDINVFHTYSLNEIPKPYSFGESATLKLKGWLNVFKNVVK